MTKSLSSGAWGPWNKRNLEHREGKGLLDENRKRDEADRAPHSHTHRRSPLRWIVVWCAGAIVLLILPLVANMNFLSDTTPGLPAHLLQNLVRNLYSSRADVRGRSPAPPVRSPKSPTGSKDSTQGEGATAVCLVGGARTFEATGPSILKHLLREYEPCDVFVHAPLDENAAKLWILKDGSSLVSVRVYPNSEVDSSRHPTEILMTNGAPNGDQGLLQYFRLVEGCLEMVLARERETGSQYKWIVRARLDSYWSRPVPPLASFNVSAYNVPYGSNYLGYNDRFGVGLRSFAIVAMSRLSLLPMIKEKNLSSNHNSELAYKMQFVVNGVAVAEHHTPFCVLTHRFKGIPMNSCAYSAAYFASNLSMDGTYCLPCKLCDDKPDITALFTLYKHMGLMLDHRRGGKYNVTRAKNVKLCELEGAWAPGLWEQRFDRAVDPEFARARQEMSATNYTSCVKKWNLFRRTAVHFDGPKAEAVCMRPTLGAAMRVGEGDWSFPTFLTLLGPDSLILVPPTTHRGDQSWERRFSKRARVRVVPWSEATLISLPKSLEGFNARVVDALKLSVEGDDYGFIHEWIKQGRMLPVCQLLVAFPHKSGKPAVHTSLTAAWEMVEVYVRRRDVENVLHLQLESCIGGQGKAPLRCLFFSWENCPRSSPP